MLYFKSILLPKLGNIVDMNDKPVNDTLPTHEKRIKKVMKRIFGGSKIEDDAYWSILYKMISDSDKKYGIVAIDGWSHDAAGKDDLGVTLNMGIPRLRGRKFNYLDRIYVRLSRQPDIIFLNSKQDNNKQPHFLNQFSYSANHPHISNGKPCLGGFATTLSKWKTEGNAIMFLKNLNQYVNTWNRRSPYWDINHTPPLYTTGEFPDNDLLIKKSKEYQYSKICQSMNLSQERHHRAHKDTLQRFDKVVHRITAPNQETEIDIARYYNQCAEDFYHYYCHEMSETLPDDIKQYQRELKSYCETWAPYDDDRERYYMSRNAWELAHFGTTRQKLRDASMLQSLHHVKENGVYKIRTVPSADASYVNFVKSDEFYQCVELLASMGNVLWNAPREAIEPNELARRIDKIVMNDWLYLYNKYSHPKVYEYIHTVAKMQSKIENWQHRLYATSNSTSNKKYKELYKYHSKNLNDQSRINARIHRHCKNLITKDIKKNGCLPIYDEYIKRNTHYKVETDSALGRKHVTDMGEWIRAFGGYNLNSINQVKTLLNVKEFPTTYRGFIDMYENFKKSVRARLIHEQSKELNNIRRKAGYVSYEYKANNTKQDSQQVPLSFETV